MTENSVVEQLRLQEGRLFQNEKTLALYLDVKGVVHDKIIKALEDDSLEALRKYDDDVADSLSECLVKLGPQGVPEYHSKSLHDCVKLASNLLWPSQILVVDRPKINTLLHGVVSRLVTQDTVKNKKFLNFDPIKQDFLYREAFRRCIVNDCLVIFDGADDGQGPNDGHEDGHEDGLDGIEDDVGPDDSASHAGISQVQDVIKKPTGARSALGPVNEDEAPEESEIAEEYKSTISKLDRIGRAQSVAPSVAKSMAQSMAPSQAPTATSKYESVADGESGAPRSVIQSAAPSVAPSVAPSMAPKVATTAAEMKSNLSRASGQTATSIMRKAINVRKVHIEPDT
jgi:hypothetical protein